ncbi:hypothetical protein [Dyella sp.]|uniref:hypothetical protein n=1 Tax=Dyella sp. TaxID=1869338 RepID=UPI00284432B8|nr:hypothetical protein [Dyella sp.]MDR3445974.1 hypothetical protein [Dyella sp.]
MAKLFICNTTKQKWHHSFRVPEMERLYFVPIPAGSQVEISHDLSAESHKAIVAQLERYGGRDASTINGKLEDFPGIFYRFEKPIGVDEILSGHAAVVEAAEQRSAGAVVKSALANDAVHRDQTGHRLVSESEIEVTEQVKPGQKATGKEKKIKIGVANDGTNTLKMPGA